MPKKMGHQISCAAFWVKGVAETLKAEGLDVAALFHDARLDTTALSDPDSRFRTERVSLLWQLAVARSGNLAIGLAKSNISRPCRRGIRYSLRCMSGWPANTSNGWTMPR